MSFHLGSATKERLALILSCLLVYSSFASLPAVALAQDTLTGAYEGRVTDSKTKQPIAGATIEFTHKTTGILKRTVTNERGDYYKGLLQPGLYLVRASAPRYQSQEVENTLYATRKYKNDPLPFELAAIVEVSIPTPTAATGAKSDSKLPEEGVQPVPGQPSANETVKPATDTSIDKAVSTKPTPTLAGVKPTPTPVSAKPTPTPPNINDKTPSDAVQPVEINYNSGRRGATFSKKELTDLPLGTVTTTRTFDELALLSWAITPPQTLGGASGPGIGAGVGSAGQFSVNGLRSRANNFTVDGSDNNDEDVGVRRQGFFALVPQPIESVQEYQVITTLAPAQFGRNFGAQVNAVSKSGGAEHHGTLYSFFNHDALNVRNFFDQRFTPPVNVLGQNNRQVIDRRFDPDTKKDIDRPLAAYNRVQREKFRFAQFGFAVGGPIVKNRAFYFLSGEGQGLDSTRMAHFAVPTLAERGFLGKGETGLSGSDFSKAFQLPPSNLNIRPVTAGGAAIFSLFPFPNNPDGVYGRNTFTQTLRANGTGRIVSGRFDGNFDVAGRAQSVTGRYNATSDARDLPVTGGAIFSSLIPEVVTQNISTYLNSDLSSANSTRPVFNQLRLSYGRTNLRFNEAANRDFLMPSQRFPGEAFLLNAPYLGNETLPSDLSTIFARRGTTEDFIGPIGQVNVAGYSPIGADVFNFPQARVNNTYQIADELTARISKLNFAVGVDFRRTELNSNLPRNSRPLITFNNVSTPVFPKGISATDFVAAGAPSGFFQSLATREANLSLRYYQYNSYGQVDWRVKPNLSLALGLRYEYNTPPREIYRRIENTFSSPDSALLSGLDCLLAGLPASTDASVCASNKRRQIFDPDHNNFAPRVGVAYSRQFLRNWDTVFRGGYGLYYDQVIGAVVSQSRNVFPNFVTVNFGGGQPGQALGIFNPTTVTVQNQSGQQTPLVQAGLNALNLGGFNNSLANLIGDPNKGTGINGLNFPSAYSLTLPARRLPMPVAHQYAFTIEQQFGGSLVVSVGYVGTRGQHLLRLTTPNLGPNNIISPNQVIALLPNGTQVGDLERGFITGTEQPVPSFRGTVNAPCLSYAGDTCLSRRPYTGLGAVYIFETDSNSGYNALQMEMRGRYRSSLNYQLGYTWSKAIDEASDVFDLAGASALAQNSFDRRGERGLANFDLTHRFTYYITYALPQYNGSRFGQALLNGWQVASTGQLQSGQPFTVNSLYDVNGDGNFTDRPNSVNGIVVTNRRERPLALNSAVPLAPFGTNGQVGRNTFRNGNFVLLNAAISKNFVLTERQSLTFRAELFNFINRTNFGIPVRYLEAPGDNFGKSVDVLTPNMRLQLALKYIF